MSARPIHNSNQKKNERRGRGGGRKRKQRRGKRRGGGRREEESRKYGTFNSGNNFGRSSVEMNTREKLLSHP